MPPQRLMRLLAIPGTAARAKQPPHEPNQARERLAALFGQWLDSDFGDGRTDSDGWVLKVGYAPVKNFTFTGTYFINTLNKDVGTQLDFKRLQLDMNYKF